MAYTLPSASSGWWPGAESHDRRLVSAQQRDHGYEEFDHPSILRAY
jgi:hypothetical protein